MSSKQVIKEEIVMDDRIIHQGAPSILSILCSTEVNKKCENNENKKLNNTEIEDCILNNLPSNIENSINENVDRMKSSEANIICVSANAATCIILTDENANQTLKDSKSEVDNNFQSETNEIINEADENNDKDSGPEEIEDFEEEEEDKNENVVEAKDFMYFKQQCKFEKFVTQLSTDGKGPDALKSILGGYFNDKQKVVSDEKINEEVVGFDTRFLYTNEGLLVYDVNSNIKIDKQRKESNGITVQDYKVFLHTIPIVRYDKDIKFDYYQKFKSYTNALAPFAGLELANEHERKIYEFLPPFKSTKVHEK